MEGVWDEQDKRARAHTHTLTRGQRHWEAVEGVRGEQDVVRGGARNVHRLGGKGATNVRKGCPEKQAHKSVQPLRTWRMATKA